MARKRKWKLETGFCPWGHPLDECHRVLKSGYNRCRITEEAKRKTRKPTTKRINVTTEWRCNKCEAPLMGGRHILGMECK